MSENETPVDNDIPAKSESHKPRPPKAPRRRVGGSKAALFLVALVLGLALGRFACSPSGAGGAPADDAAVTQAAATIWTCSMHPQIRMPEPGQCPICGMDLIPVTGSDDEGLDPRSLTMSANAAAMAEIVTQPVERRSASREVRMVGKVTFDETRLSYITAWVPSRLDRLFVDYTGISVRKGDHLAEVYSPDLIATQQELLQAIATENLLANSPAGVVKARQAGSVQSARDRLRLWGLDAAQIEEIIARGEPFEHITINSPVAGIVVHKNALQGDYVQTGTRIYTIADLTKVWVQLEAYESDLAWLHYGQHVEFLSEAWPGETFQGRVSFIDPVLDDRTRTVKVRLNVDNADLRLKPEMFVRATVLAPITAEGLLIDPELADMWMCPMHPEVVSEDPGACSVCGMDLVPTAELGFRVVDAEELPLVIPSTAPLITGKRAVVYVRVPGTDRPTFQGREVLLGPRVGDWYVVDEGLAEGDEVVVHGAFKLDSELQIRARPSMMSPSGGAPPPGHEHRSTPAPDAFREQLGALIAPYVDIQSALAADDPGGARASAQRLSEALGRVDMALLDGPGHATWMGLDRSLSAATRQLSGSDDIDVLRPAFRDLSDALIGALERFGYSGIDEAVWVFHCPMAFGAGADWLQPGLETANPYYGAQMLRCGNRVRDLATGR